MELCQIYAKTKYILFIQYSSLALKNGNGNIYFRYGLESFEYLLLFKSAEFFSES
jgi:hypothetical protein